MKVAKLADGVLKLDGQACNGCGRCKAKCPFGVTEEYQEGCRIYIGGRWGKKIANGRPLDKLFTSEDEVLDTVERAILFFRDEGITGERFADTVNRLGFEYVQEKLLFGEVDKCAWEKGEGRCDLLGISGKAGGVPEQWEMWGMAAAMPYVLCR